MDVEKFRSECLKAHNAYRKCHGADPVALNKDLNDGAQKWADKMAATSKFKHDDVKVGENIAYSMQPQSPSGYQITKLWYDEEKDYDYSTHKTKNPGKAVGHFTQVVWKNTSEVGFGIARKDENYYAVGRYAPAGNFMMSGEYEKNVGHKTGEPGLPELKDEATDVGEGKPALPACGGQAGEMPTPGTSVETKTETYIENGYKMTKTTTTTTTVTKLPNGKLQKSTSTETQTQKEKLEHDATEKLEKLTM